MIAHPIIRGVSLLQVVKLLEEKLQKLQVKFKKCVLELGGSDAFIVCEDADQKSSKKKQARLQNNGQTCVAGKKIYHSRKSISRFCRKIHRRVSKISTRKSYE